MPGKVPAGTTGTVQAQWAEYNEASTSEPAAGDGTVAAAAIAAAASAEESAEGFAAASAAASAAAFAEPLAAPAVAEAFVEESAEVRSAQLVEELVA